MVVLPSSLVGHHLVKSFEVALNNLLISQHIRIVGFSFFITCFISLYSLLIWEVSILYKMIFQRFVSFPRLPLGSNTQ